MSDKTEQPTPKKLLDAKKKGNVAQSKEVGSAVTFLVGVVLIFNQAPKIGEGFENLFRLATEIIPRIDGQNLATVTFAPMREAMLVWISSIMLVMLGIALSGVAAAVGQVGLNLTAEPMKPSLSKLNPIEGVKRIFSLKGLVEFLKTLIKVALVMILGYMAVSKRIEDVIRLHWADLGAIYSIGVDIARSFTFQVAGALLAVAAADYAISRMQWKKGLMMTKQEIKEEYKESEGDPMVKGQRKQLAQQMAMEEVRTNVPKADAVITNPTHLAIAVRYERGSGRAPKVTAKGGGAVAKTIVQLAKQHDVPIIRDITLARSLFSVEVGRGIPKELYEATAEILLFAWRLKQEAERAPGAL